VTLYPIHFGTALCAVTC